MARNVWHVGHGNLSSKSKELKPESHSLNSFGQYFSLLNSEIISPTVQKYFLRYSLMDQVVASLFHVEDLLERRVGLQDPRAPCCKGWAIALAVTYWPRGAGFKGIALQVLYLLHKVLFADKFDLYNTKFYYPRKVCYKSKERLYIHKEVLHIWKKYYICWGKVYLYKRSIFLNKWHSI